MPSKGHRYRLVGFSDEVDRRPLLFVEPLPVAKVCSACGLVSRRIAQHQCEHYFCKSCIDQCQHENEVFCPHDGEACEADEITWISHSTKSVMAKQVLCWNEANGCNVITAAAGISKHFHRECGHHATRCGKCNEGILASHVCAHLKSLCEPSDVPDAAADHATETSRQEQEFFNPTCLDVPNSIQRIYHSVSTAMFSTQAQLKEITRALKVHASGTTSGAGQESQKEIRSSVEEIIYCIVELQRELHELFHYAYGSPQAFESSFVEINESSKESTLEVVQSKTHQNQLAAQFTAFRESLGDRQRETRVELDRLARAIDFQCGRMSRLSGTANALAESQTENTLEATQALAENLARNALKVLWAKPSFALDTRDILRALPSVLPIVTTHTWALGGYASLKRRAQQAGFGTEIVEPAYLCGYYVATGIHLDKNGHLSFLFNFYEGRLDKFLDWEFDRKVKFSFVHPDREETLEHCVKPDWYGRDLGRSRCWHPIGGGHFTSAGLEERGFVKDDQITISLAFDPQDGSDQ